MLYSIVATFLRPVFRWARMRVEGRELVPAEGPVLIVPNHDSQWDPLAVAVAVRRTRRIRFLARANLWKHPGRSRADDLVAPDPGRARVR